MRLFIEIKGKYNDSRLKQLILFLYTKLMEE